MRHKLARALYRNGVDHPRIDYRNPESHFNIDRMRKQLEETIQPGCRVLDLGCNTGRFCFHAETLEATAVGVDCTIEALEVAVDIKQEIKSAAHFAACDLLHLPFRANTFDLAVFPENIIMFSIEEMRQVADHLARILTPGGLFCISVQDAVEQVASHQHWLKDYDPFNGQIHAVTTIPDKGPFENAHYVWTLPLIKIVLEPWFQLHHEERIDDRRYWLILRNTR